MRVTWRVKRSNQPFLKEISPEYSLEGLMLKLKLQYFGHLMQLADSFDKTLMLGKIEGRRRRGRQKGWLNGITNSMDMSLSKLQEMVKDRTACCSPWGRREPDTTERLYNKRVVIIYGGKDKYQVPIPSGRMKGNEKGNNSLTR